MSNEAPTEQLLPCPLCGSTDLFLRDTAGWELDCRNCELSLVLADDPTREGLVARWNTRASDFCVERLERTLCPTLSAMNNAIGEIEWLHSRAGIISGDCGAILLLRTSISELRAALEQKEK